jgi:hypothetical protein
VKTLRQAFLALQAALPAVPPDTKLSKLDVLVLATSYIAHLTRTLGHELPGPAWPPFVRGLRYLHPLKVGNWPRNSVRNIGRMGIGIIFLSFSQKEDRGWLLGWNGDWERLHWECACCGRRERLRFLVSGEERSAGSWVWGKEGVGENLCPTRVLVLWRVDSEDCHMLSTRTRVGVWLCEATDPTWRVVDKGQS